MGPDAPSEWSEASLLTEAALAGQTAARIAKVERMIIASDR
jgi:hypothetical protein